MGRGPLHLLSGPSQDPFYPSDRPGNRRSRRFVGRRSGYDRGVNDDDGSTPTPSHESRKERVDRELIELLNELRIALPGVQVLFAFLLTMPLTDRFGDLTDLQRTIYFSTFTATTLASALLMAPTAYHRLRFREGDKERMLHTANRQAIAGTALLSLAIGGAALLVADLTYELTFATVFGAMIFSWVVALWFVLPLTRKARDN